MGRPRQEDAIDIPRLAVENTIALLRRRGSPDFSLAEVAREIGCSAPALYNHFTGKDDLLAQVRTEIYARSVAEKQTRYGGLMADPGERLRQGGRAYVDFARENPALFRVVYGVQSGGALAETIPAQALAALGAGVRACRPCAREEAERLALTMWSAAHGAAFLALDGLAPGKDADARWNAAYATVDTMVDLITAPPQPTA